MSATFANYAPALKEMVRDKIEDCTYGASPLLALMTRKTIRHTRLHDDGHCSVFSVLPADDTDGVNRRGGREHVLAVRPLVDGGARCAQRRGTPPMPAPGMPPAIPETTQQLTEWGLKEVSPGVWSQPAMPDIQMSAGDWLKYGLGTLGSSLGGQIASGLGSSLTQQTGDSQSLMGLLGKLSPSLLGMYASNQQANKLSELAQKYQDFGAPYRQKLAEISADPNAFYNSEGAQKATDTVLRKLSIGGNPAGSANKQALTIDSLYDQYGKERDRLAGFGGLTNYNQAAPQLETQAIGANANMWNAAGAGLNDIFNPKPSLSELFKQMKTAGAF